MQDSHTAASADETTADSSPLRLVSSSAAGLPGWLAGRVDEHLAAFAAHMTQGLLAASTAVGLEVMAELMDRVRQERALFVVVSSAVRSPPMSWAAGFGQPFGGWPESGRSDSLIATLTGSW
jgi:hypothetical protein